jgi:hypothetical protein
MLEQVHCERNTRLFVVCFLLAHYWYLFQGKAWIGAAGAMLMNGNSALKKVALDPLMRTPYNAASTILFAALAPAEVVEGQYVKPPHTVVAKPWKVSSNTELKFCKWLSVQSMNP